MAVVVVAAAKTDEDVEDDATPAGVASWVAAWRDQAFCPWPRTETMRASGLGPSREDTAVSQQLEKRFRKCAVGDAQMMQRTRCVRRRAAAAADDADDDDDAAEALMASDRGRATG